jgi:uncharacterized protein (TIGR02231 family)
VSGGATSDLAIAEVVVFEDRARVVRRGQVTVARGQARVTVSPVSPVVVDKSVVARIGQGRATVLDVQIRRELAPWRAGPDAIDPRAAAGERAALHARLEDARARRRAQADRAAAAAATAQALGGLLELARRELVEEAAWGRQVPDAAARLTALAERARAAAVEAATIAVDVDEAASEIGALERELAAREQALGKEVAAIAIDLESGAGDGELAVDVELEYVVPAACWRPYHAATLRGAQPSAEVELATDACVWQATGEDWREVRLRFSTERPSLGTRPPVLIDDRLSVQPKGALVVSARDQEIVNAGLGAGTRQADELPGVDDGGIARVLAAPLAASVPADGRPYRVRLSSFTAAAEVARVAFPERAAGVIVRSRQVHSGQEPLLAGPVDLIARGGLTGRTSIKFVAPGERFDLGWGPDPELRLHREARSKREPAGLLSWAATTHRVAVRLSNLGGSARTVLVTERVPVSEVEKVEIALSPPEAWKLEDDDGVRRDPTPLVTARTVDADGMVTWTVELPARARRAIALEYVIKAHDSVSGL